MIAESVTIKKYLRLWMASVLLLFVSLSLLVLFVYLTEWIVLYFLFFSICVSLLFYYFSIKHLPATEHCHLLHALFLADVYARINRPKQIKLFKRNQYSIFHLALNYGFSCELPSSEIRELYHVGKEMQRVLHLSSFLNSLILIFGRF